MRKHVPRVLGLALLAALYLTALAASSAQAAEIQVGGSAALATGVELTGEEEGSGSLSVPSLGIEKVCKAGTVASKVTNGPSGTGSATLTFTGCSVMAINAKGELTGSMPCTVGEPLVFEGSGQVVLHEGRSYLSATGSFGIIKFSGEECTLPAKVEAKGSIAIKIATGDLNVGPGVVEPLLETNSVIQKLLGAKLFFGKSEGFLTGSAKVKISAPAVDVGKTVGFK